MKQWLQRKVLFGIVLKSCQMIIAKLNVHCVKKILSRGGTEKHKMTTTNLRNHLKNAHKEVYKKFNQDTDTENS